ncbi:hypothetical protein BTA51_04115 [Hahella sp. CCB-MM4]|uniref:pyridoxamine 5'-phosphate oxidase family protein n=1 Tax=Hahella sp. (strain CCB-MM4) TaxID=1926491 RepID=UPI000B9C0524|nr:pyridoxamine 5'-phosphate oxidase family protein [Hahella sp. CCB-MM4]OZG74211.1 hypothetical protein BTA51_04115 [Hahella sp. CCB-MM4]
MQDPIKLMKHWLMQEKETPNQFPLGAVLSTTSSTGSPRSRVIGTMLDSEGIPKFHTSPGSRKISDIEHNHQVSLTYPLQCRLRSISLEGKLSLLSENELREDWLKYSDDFRKHYLVFGAISGSPIDSLHDLRQQRDALPKKAEQFMPSSFIGYKFSSITRIAFYEVLPGDFAEAKVFHFDESRGEWQLSLVAP